jgi:UDP-N-acetylmuramate dehydrogenase
VKNVGKIREKINLPCPVSYDEPMSLHTSFRIGGPADMYLSPRNAEEAAQVYALLNRRDIPTFILGAGANILVSDRGIRGAVIDTGGLQGCSVSRTGDRGVLSAQAGTAISDASALALEHGLSGLEFIYSMPGSAGGSVWMNARCYGLSIREALLSVSCAGQNGEITTVEADQRQFGYKRSPFQGSRLLILEVTFGLVAGQRQPMREQMHRIKEDREQKGHFSYPCAGSIFKNNRSFGNPTGKLVDALGLKGTSVGDARVSELHGNIIVNTGAARAEDVLELIRLLEREVRRAFGFELEREILPVGQWGEEAS